MVKEREGERSDRLRRAARARCRRVIDTRYTSGSAGHPATWRGKRGRVGGRQWRYEPGWPCLASQQVWQDLCHPPKEYTSFSGCVIVSAQRLHIREQQSKTVRSSEPAGGVLLQAVLRCRE
ncbi:hypothetical protein AAFF_G00076930 [Aldrovandia affinis]|uniref:Uncharacterized protein n=1 Tax=Aldrovandia affinis TaxID=143900 RepID=A0AAD7RXX2_9TELE|nr:hypothetical protein AAFF_G00076930 [Aldrovandia affinis]